jgi:hypothetical protein
VPCGGGTTVTTYHRDRDGDGLGDPTGGVQSCTAVEGSVANDRDCNDDDPGAREWNVDADGDGYTVECPSMPGRGVATFDCDESDAGVHPFAEELALDGIDSDCDGLDAPVLLDCSALPTYDASLLVPRSECNGLSDLFLVAIGDCWSCQTERVDVVVGNRGETAVAARLSFGDPGIDVDVGVLAPRSLSGTITLEIEALPFVDRALSVLPLDDAEETCAAVDSSHVMTYGVHCLP